MACHPQRDNEQYSDEEAQRRFLSCGQSRAEYKADAPKEYHSEARPGAIEESKKGQKLRIGTVHIVAFTAVVSLLLISIVNLSSASAQTTQSVQVPAEQKALSDILSKYNDLAAGAPNEIQQKKIRKEYEREFCDHLPTGDVSGWVGEVEAVDDRGAGNSIELTLWVHTYDLHTAPGLGFDIVLQVENFGEWKGLRPHAPTEIPVGSPLYDIAANLRSGDAVRFDGTFVPYVSKEACYDFHPAATVGLVRFKSLKRLGWNIHLE